MPEAGNTIAIDGDTRAWNPCVKWRPGDQQTSRWGQRQFPELVMVEAEEAAQAAYRALDAAVLSSTVFLSFQNRPTWSTGPTLPPCRMLADHFEKMSVVDESGLRVSIHVKESEYYAALHQAWRSEIPRSYATFVVRELASLLFDWQDICDSLVREQAVMVMLADDQPTLNVSPEAEEFLEAKELAGEFFRARAIALQTFDAAQAMNVALESDPGEEDSPPTLVIGVVTSMDSSTFRDARKRFFRTLRWAGCERLCLSLAVVRE